MKIEIEKAVAEVEHRGKTYYFCMEGCKERFEADPDRYVDAKAAS